MQTTLVESANPVVARGIAQQFYDLYNEMSYSDLQGCVGAAVSKLGLGQWEAWSMEVAVLDIIAENHTL